MRLIDADRLRDEGWTLHKYDSHVMHEKAKYIEEIPTAYDMGKVMQQLEEHFNGTENRDVRLAYHHAIEIVKGGTE